MDNHIIPLIDKAALRTLAEEYAIGADRRDKTVWARVLSEDWVIEGPGFHYADRDACMDLINQLTDLFTVTRHNIFNQTTDIDGDTASGETYCLSSHLSESDGVTTVLDWHLRYQDKWRRTQDGWVFTHRNLVLDWQETSTLVQDETPE